MPKRAKKYVIDHITCHILWPEHSCFVVLECFLWHRNARLVYIYQVTITGWLVENCTHVSLMYDLSLCCLQGERVTKSQLKYVHNLVFTLRCTVKQLDYNIQLCVMLEMWWCFSSF